MTEFNTLNPVPSSDVRDLLDNATIEDKLVNGLEASYPDRFGRPLKSKRGMELEFAAFLAASGFELPALAYVDGSPLTVDRPTQLIERDGILYSVKATDPFPATLTGAWATDQTRLVVRADDSLRQDLADASGSEIVGFTNGGAGSVDRTVAEKLIESVSIGDFGGVGDGVADNLAALYAAVASGAKAIHFPAGDYWFSSNPVLDGLDGVTFRGDSAGSTSLKWASGQFALKSPVNVTFKNIGFYPVADDVLMPAVWASNYTDITFSECSFKGFGGDTQNKTSSTCLYLYAGDITSATLSPGNSSGAVVSNCRFYGGGRFTNFGVRVYTEFGVPGVATNIGAIISGCTFDEFNWNAVEIAGPMTSGALVTDCVANRCGLVPFDLDKGCHDCTVSDVIINRLLGNIDLIANPSTRVVVATVQGISPSTGYAYNNTVKNVVARLLKADIEAYGNGVVAASIAYGQNNIIDGVEVFCDGVPVRGVGKRFGLACVSFETASGNEIRNVRVTNASAGIVQTASQNTNMTSSEPNIFLNIKNIGTMTEEPIQVSEGASALAFSRNIIKDCSFKSNLTNPFYTGLLHAYAIHAAASGSSVHFLKIKDSTIDLATGDKWFIFNQIPRLSLENVVLNDNGSAAAARFAHSEGSAVPAYMGLSEVSENFGQAPLDLTSALQNIDQTTEIGARLTDQGFPLRDSGTLFSASQPMYPPAAFWNVNLRVERVTKVAASYIGWTVVAGAWKTYGTVSA